MFKIIFIGLCNDFYSECKYICRKNGLYVNYVYNTQWNFQIPGVYLKSVKNIMYIWCLIKTFDSIHLYNKIKDIHFTILKMFYVYNRNFKNSLQQYYSIKRMGKYVCLKIKYLIRLNWKQHKINIAFTF